MYKELIGESVVLSVKNNSLCSLHKSLIKYQQTENSLTWHTRWNVYIHGIYLLCPSWKLRGKWKTNLLSVTFIAGQSDFFTTS